MRRGRVGALALGALAGALLAAGAARAQEAAPTPDVPPGPAAIRGRVVHPARPEAAAGVDVVLYALPAEGMPGLRRARSDAQGAFAFEGVSNDPATAYLVGARFADVPYAGERLSFAPGETERAVEVRIADVSPDPRAVRVREVVVRLDPIGGELAVNESVRIENAGTTTVFVPAALRAPAAAPFATRLPPGAQRFAMPLGVVPEGVSLTGEELAFFGPIYPGGNELDYTYVVPAAGAAPGATARVSLDRRFAAGVERLVLLAPAQGPAAAPPAGFSGPEDADAEGRTYRRYVRESLAPGAHVAFGLDVPAAERRPGALTVGEVRLFLELDDAALLAREEYHFTVSGSGSVVGDREAPLLRIPLPAGAQRLGFHPDFGLQPGAEGGIVVLGPVPAGDSVLEIAYRLPPVVGSAELAREFAAPVSLLGVYVVDSGLLVDSPRLHRRRPVRGNDRTFAHLEAFELEAGETVAIRFAPLAPRRGLPRAATVALAFLGAGAAILFLSAPLRRPGVAIEGAAPEASAARRERESLIVAIRDLDHDYETGKVAEDDWRTLREELRARAMAYLREERDAAARGGDAVASSSAPAADVPVCPGCSAVARPADRFCAQCGAALAPPGRSHGARG
jgi:hypothetical protein